MSSSSSRILAFSQFSSLAALSSITCTASTGTYHVGSRNIGFRISFLTRQRRFWSHNSQIKKDMNSLSIDLANFGRLKHTDSIVNPSTWEQRRIPTKDFCLPSCFDHCKPDKYEHVVAKQRASVHSFRSDTVPVNSKPVTVSNTLLIWQELPWRQIGHVAVIQEIQSHLLAWSTYKFSSQIEIIPWVSSAPRLSCLLVLSIPEPNTYQYYYFYCTCGFLHVIRVETLRQVFTTLVGTLGEAASFDAG